MHEHKGVLKTIDDADIYFDHLVNDHPHVIIVAHGFFNSRRGRLIQSLGKELLAHHDVILMDFRGHGESSGIFTWTAKEFIDLETVLAFARPRYKKIGVLGFSLGAATSLITASRTHLIDSLISVSAPTQLSKIEYHFWRLNPENDIIYNLLREGRIGKGVRPGPFWLKKDKPIDIVGKIKIPVCFIHGTKDWIIRSWHSEELYQKAISHKALKIISNGPHAEYLVRKNKEEFVKNTRDWFKETME
jgi:pimeloyl-ACP methyl ester carboxylesterase